MGNFFPMSVRFVAQDAITRVTGVVCTMKYVEVALVACIAGR